MALDELSSALGTLRLLRRMSRRAVALAAGVKPQAVSDYEAGRIVPLRRTREHLAAALRVSPGFLESLAALLRSLGLTLGLTADQESLPLGLVRGMLDFSREAEALSTPPPPPAGGEPPAEALWARLRSYSPAERRAVVSEVEELRSPALVLEPVGAMIVSFIELYNSDGGFRPGFPFCRSPAPQEPGGHRRCRGVVGARDRLHDRRLQPRRRSASPAPAGAACP